MDSKVGASILDILTVACKSAWECGSPIVSSVDVLRAIAVRKRLHLLRKIKGQAALSNLQSENSPMEFMQSGEFSRLQLEYMAVFREAEMGVRRSKRLSLDIKLPIWSRQVYAAVENALSDATRLKIRYAGYVHLLAALLSEGDSDAVKVLRDSGMQAHHILEESQIRSRIHESDVSLAPGALNLVLFGLVEGRTPRIVRYGLRVACRLRFHAMPPIGYVLRTEAIRQACRLGSEVVRPVHILVAIVALHEQLVIESRQGSSFTSGENAAGLILTTRGADYECIATQLVKAVQLSDHSGVTHSWRTLVGEPSALNSTAQVLKDAQRRAKETRSQSMGTNHVLGELLRDPEGDPSRLLVACGVNVEQIMALIELVDCVCSALKHPRIRTSWLPHGIRRECKL